MLTRVQNVLTGWGCGIGITFAVVALQYENYGGESRVLFSKTGLEASPGPSTYFSTLRIGILQVFLTNNFF
jgi:hypothetical protein